MENTKVCGPIKSEEIIIFMININSFSKIIIRLMALTIVYGTSICGVLERSSLHFNENLGPELFPIFSSASFSTTTKRPRYHHEIY